MTYIIWIVFALIMLAIFWQAKNARDEYRQAKAAEEKDSELAARRARQVERAIGSERTQGQAELGQGSSPELSKVFGAQSRKESVH